MEEFEREEIDECRNIVLNWIIAAYPAGIQEERLIRSAMSLPRPIKRGLIRKDLAYLADKAIALIESFTAIPPGKDAPVVYWRATAKGKRFDELDRPWERVQQL